MELYHRQFSQELDVRNAPATQRTLIVASTPRSGSHMLGHSLAEAGIFGVPFEYANPGNLAEWQRKFSLSDPLETMREIMRRRTGENGLFAIKLHHTHLSLFGGFEGMMAFFPNPQIVRIVRRNVLNQAISLSTARQTRVWIEGQVGSGQEAVYKDEMIEDCLRTLVLGNAAWTYDLARTGTSEHEVFFEDAVQDLPGTLQSIASYLGIAVDPERLPSTPPTRKQSSSGKNEWAERFLAKQGRKGLDESIVQLHSNLEVKTLTSLRSAKNLVRRVQALAGKKK
ncbi:MAG: Stf0 family sulfotransferase [Pseudomonadota bacterium]|nr:Stf0 family sulfotransferase [Pseudomonadota bacterium]